MYSHVYKGILNASDDTYVYKQSLSVAPTPFKIHFKSQNFIRKLDRTIYL